MNQVCFSDSIKCFIFEMLGIGFSFLIDSLLLVHEKKDRQHLLFLDNIIVFIIILTLNHENVL